MRKLRLHGDVDFGASLLRTAVAVAALLFWCIALACSLPWSERHTKNAFPKPVQRIKTAVGNAFGIGQKFVGVGKEIGKGGV